MNDPIDTETMRWKAAQRAEMARLGMMLGEVLFFEERRRSGWPVPRLDATEPAPPPPR